MIEIKETNKAFVLTVNGKIINAQIAGFKLEGSQVFSAFIQSENTKEIVECYVSDLPLELHYINSIYQVDCDLMDSHWNSFEFGNLGRSKIKDVFSFTYVAVPDLQHWKASYSFIEYVKEFERLAPSADCHNLFISQSEMHEEAAEISLDVYSPKMTLRDEIQKYANLIFQFEEQVIKSLLSKVREQSLLTYFEFPEEVKVPCEQYLLYFIQFLKDLGVEATADIQHEAGQVLFSVTPTDKEMALDKIRDALDIYIRLPARPDNELSSSDEVAIQRLEANVYHLKSQLKLARAEILASEKVLQAQHSIINSQQRLIDGLVILESAKIVRPQQEKEDKEDVLPGVLAVTKYKGKGFELGLPEIFRRLKSYLHRK